MPRREKSLEEQYKPYLIRLMRFKDSVDYQPDYEFTNEQLGLIRNVEAIQHSGLFVPVKKC